MHIVGAVSANVSCHAQSSSCRVNEYILASTCMHAYVRAYMCVSGGSVLAAVHPTPDRPTSAANTPPLLRESRRGRPDAGQKQAFLVCTHVRACAAPARGWGAVGRIRCVAPKSEWPRGFLLGVSIAPDIQISPGVTHFVRAARVHVLGQLCP